jgi:NADH:ubiquinone oxidoreductase subunit F (NADH-binding)
MSPRHGLRPSGPRDGTSQRLTVAWRLAGGPAGLSEHCDIYGPLPGAGLGPADLIDAVQAAGLTGRGGAGFPTGTKMRAVAARRGRAVVVANAVESEPASQKDQALLGQAPHLVLDGAALAARAVGADTVHLCLSRGRPQQAGQVIQALGERWQARLDSARFLVHELPEQYVASEETALIRWLNGGEAKPAPAPPRPFEKGVNGVPTLVDNVETLAHLALIARYGPRWFRQAGTPDAPGTMLITAGGAVASPGVHEVQAGTPVGEVLARCGAPDDAAVLIGGYFGTWHQVREVGRLPLGPAGLRPAGASPGAGVLLALPAVGCGLTETARILAYLARQSAGQCGPCTFGLPAIASDFAQLARGRPDGDVLERLDRRLAVIPGRGACRHPDGAVRLAASALRTFAADARAHAAGRPCLGAHRRRTELPIPRPWAEGDWR